MDVNLAARAGPGARRDPEGSPNPRHPLDQHEDRKEAAGLSIGAVLLLLHQLDGAWRDIFGEIRT